MASLTWNSNGWRALPTEMDLKDSHHKYVRSFKKSNDAFNFGHPNAQLVDVDGYYWGFVPALFSKSINSKKSEKIKIILFHSKSTKAKRQYMVGIYLSPLFFRTIDNILIPSVLSNVKVLPKNIISTHIPLLDLDIARLLPEGKELANQGFNVIDEQNILYILNYIKETDCTDINSDKINIWISENIQDNNIKS